MATLNRLSAVKVKAAAKPGLVADGGGLYLQVTPRLSGGVAKSWIFRFTWHGRERKSGLGSLDAVSLADARQVAAECRSMVARGIDPVETRRALRAADGPPKPAAPTFQDCARQFMAAKESEWSNAVHREQWRQSLRDHVNPVIGKMPVDQIDLPAILRVLKPIWTAKPETASRVRGRVESILAWAKVMKHRDGENPATWRGNLDHLLPKPSKIRAVKHHPALPYADVPAFMTELRGKPGVVPLAVEFLILTAARTAEVRGARWSEIDLAGKVWTVPPQRMKGRVEHRVPLSARCVEILESMAAVRQGDHVFPGRKSGGLSEAPMLDLLKQIRPDATVHGMRSSLKDWAAEKTSFPDWVSEKALAHKVGDETRRAYQRGDLLEKRRILMEQWAQYCTNPPGGIVVPFERKEVPA